MALTGTPTDLGSLPTSQAMRIPPSWYVDPAQFERERELVFRRTWQWVGRVDQVAEPGGYFTCEVDGEPVVVVKGEDGELRAYSNVCLHRAGPVARGEGNAKHFRCSYHGWSYGLDGCLLATPHFERLEGEDGCLPRIRVETWDPFVFVNLDPEARPLSETLGDLQQRFSAYRLADLKFRRQVVLEAACNWKVLEENARECYHCPNVHPSFTAAYEVEKAVTETRDFCSILSIEQRSSTRPTKRQESLVRLAKNIAEFRRGSPARTGLKGKEATRLYFIFPFPNFFLTLAPDHFSASRIISDGVERIRQVRDFFFEPGEAQEIVDQNVEFRAHNMKEDLAICEAVQRGLHSRYYKPGRYSSQEPAVYHFHTVLRRMLQ